MIQNGSMIPSSPKSPREPKNLNWSAALPRLQHQHHVIVKPQLFEGFPSKPAVHGTLFFCWPLVDLEIQTVAAVLKLPSEVGSALRISKLSASLLFQTRSCKQLLGSSSPTWSREVVLGDLFLQPRTATFSCITVAQSVFLFVGNPLCNAAVGKKKKKPASQSPQCQRRQNRPVSVPFSSPGGF